MSNLKLFHGPVLIGTISNITPEFEGYKPIFSFLLSNDGLTDGSDPPFEESYFDNWVLEDESGKQQSIGIPAIEDGEVIWREGK